MSAMIRSIGSRRAVTNDCALLHATKGHYCVCWRLMMASEQKAEAKRAVGDECAEDTGR
jgi:hypothetical protein